MKQNENNIDRIIRVVVGIVSLALGILAFPSSIVGTIFIILGIVMLFTAATGFCLIYKILGISTKKDTK